MPDEHRCSQPLTPWQAWLSMFGIRTPLSGDVTQGIAALDQIDRIAIG